MRFLAIPAALLALVVVAPSAPAATPTYDRPIVVGGATITRASLQHWERIARRANAGRADAVQMLVSGYRLREEAARRGVVVTEAQVERAYRKRKRTTFKREAAFRRFLHETGQTREDLRFRIRLDLYSSALIRLATAEAATPEEEQAALETFVSEFEKYWLPLTLCSESYYVKGVCASPSGEPAQTGW